MIPTIHPPNRQSELATAPHPLHLGEKKPPNNKGSHPVRQFTVTAGPSTMQGVNADLNQRNALSASSKCQISGTTQAVCAVVMAYESDEWFYTISAMSTFHDPHFYRVPVTAGVEKLAAWEDGGTGLPRQGSDISIATVSRKPFTTGTPEWDVVTLPPRISRETDGIATATAESIVDETGEPQASSVIIATLTPTFRETEGIPQTSGGLSEVSKTETVTSTITETSSEAEAETQTAEGTVGETGEPQASGEVETATEEGAEATAAEQEGPDETGSEGAAVATSVPVVYKVLVPGAVGVAAAFGL